MLVRLLFKDDYRQNFLVEATNYKDAIEGAIKKCGGNPIAAAIETENGELAQFEIDWEPIVRLSTKNYSEFNVQDDSWAKEDWQE